MSDYFTRYFEIARLKSLTAGTVMEKCKNVDMKYPSNCIHILFSQFDLFKGSAFHKFADEYNVK